MTGRDHARGAPAQDVADALHARGMRMTSQRGSVLAALGRLGHATPDEIAETLAADGETLSPSTVYRNLEALEGVGIVQHSHLGHRAAAYHLASHADHLHLRCLVCESLSEVPAEVAAGFARAVAQSGGFRVDVRHMVVHGWCARCRAAGAGGPQPDGIHGARTVLDHIDPEHIDPSVGAAPAPAEPEEDA